MGHLAMPHVPIPKSYSSFHILHVIQCHVLLLCLLLPCLQRFACFVMNHVLHVITSAFVINVLSSILLHQTCVQFVHKIVFILSQSGHLPTHGHHQSTALEKQSHHSQKSSIICRYEIFFLHLFNKQSLQNPSQDSTFKSLFKILDF